jgi:hypothetical protein
MPCPPRPDRSDNQFSEGPTPEPPFPKGLSIEAPQCLSVAADAMARAEPAAVVVTSRVQRQVVGLFVAEGFKGVPEPVTLFRIVRASVAGAALGSAISHRS